MFPSLIDLNQLFQPWLFLKIAVLILEGLYFIFAIVILNQVRVMNAIITESGVSFILETIAFIHLLVALSLFLATLVIL